MPRPKPAEPKVQLAVRIPRELHRRLKVYAAMQGQSITTVVERALDAALPGQRLAPLIGRSRGTV